MANMEGVDDMSLTNVQLEERTTGIGGSEAAAVLGISPYDTPISLWRRKRGLDPAKEETAAMRWGKLLEPHVLQAYEQATGDQIIAPDMTFRMPGHPEMLANLDGLALSGKRVIEVKTTRSGMGWGEPGTAEVPVHHWIQVQHYLAVTKAELADIAVLIAGSDFRIYKIEPDREFQERLLSSIIEFWGQVQSGEQPVPLTEEECRQRWPQSVANAVKAQEADLQAYEGLLVAKRTCEEAEERVGYWKVLLQRAMGDADTLIGPNGKVLATWKTAKDSERIDEDRLRAERPEIAAEFTKVVRGGRRFLAKE